MRLQAKDLMIGDLLTFEDCVKDGKIIPIEVVELHGYNNDFLASIDGDEACDMLEFNDEIVGIPLTPEILEKNGWIYEDSLWLHEDAIILQKSFDSTNLFFWFVAGSPFLPINYVHELQHALKLCGIKKYIEV